MVGGYAGRFLDVNLSDGEISETRFEKDVLRRYLGGRGLGARILWDRLGSGWEKVDPLGPENLLLQGPGPQLAKCLHVRGFNFGGPIERSEHPRHRPDRCGF